MADGAKGTKERTRADRVPASRAAHLGPERRRPMVLDAAFELFLDRGYEGTSMEAIAAAAGITKPVVYACYPSKEDLFKALLEREEGRVLAEIAAAIPGTAEADNLEATLVRGFTAFLRAVAASPRAYRVILLGEGGGNAAVTRRIQRGRERQVEAVAALARPLLGRGLGDPELDRTARLLGHLVVGLAEAGARAMLAEPEDWTPEALGRFLGEMAARAAAAEPALPG
jgi:AcrR family transcriptional regulator